MKTKSGNLNGEAPLKHLSLLNQQLTADTFKGNIENFIGLCMVPLGLAGPLKIQGEFANGEYDIPMATTEGALVASYNRGLKAGKQAGGFFTKILEESVQRCPLYKFENARQAFSFIEWVKNREEELKAASKEGSRYAVLKTIRPTLEGNEVTLSLEFTTGDASGQNMVTICGQRIVDFIKGKSPVRPIRTYIEANASGDKKIGFQSLNRTRGKKVIAEISLPRLVVEKTLKSNPENIVNYWQSATMAQIKTGSVGNQGHIANGLTAMFLATGQDVACITEAALGINRMEITADEGLYASLTLPNLIVGTVGGGTGLATQRECLEMMDCYGTGKACRLAEIMAAVALAGELSIASAIAEGHFTEAHQKLGRK